MIHGTEPDPADMLALARDQQRSVNGRMGVFVPYILLAWAVAWLGGFLVLWLEAGPVSIPMAVAAPVCVVLFLAAGAVSVVLGIRSNRGVRTGKDAAFVGAVYGQAWWVGGIAIFAIAQGMVANGMEPELLGILYPSAYVFFAGLMYFVGGALWRAVPMVVLGAWAILVSAVAPFAGAPAHFLVFAIAGGGGFLAGAVWTFVWTERARRRVGGGDAS
ncbi:hypothetical protein [Microbacterium sp. CIAB417]|uniref:hypothetical protein n=1 Tax=Microbacterium sp. CIAB417 TaxID=2860287 RepID=UPI001FACC707|nr:hypothetical protein [Microbacterium sp. CIAB417]